MASKKNDSARLEKYSRDLLASNAEALFGVKPEAVAGALHGISHDALTLDEARSFVTKFLKRKVK